MLGVLLAVAGEHVGILGDDGGVLLGHGFECRVLEHADEHLRLALGQQTLVVSQAPFEQLALGGGLAQRLLQGHELGADPVDGLIDVGKIVLFLEGPHLGRGAVELAACAVGLTLQPRLRLLCGVRAPLQVAVHVDGADQVGQQRGLLGIDVGDLDLDELRVLPGGHVHAVLQDAEAGRAGVEVGVAALVVELDNGLSHAPAEDDLDLCARPVPALEVPAVVVLHHLVDLHLLARAGHELDQRCGCVLLGCEQAGDQCGGQRCPQHCKEGASLAAQGQDQGIEVEAADARGRVGQRSSCADRSLMVYHELRASSEHKEVASAGLRPHEEVVPAPLLHHWWPSTGEHVAHPRRVARL